MSRWLLVSLVLSACTDSPPTSTIVATSHVETYDMPGGLAPELDLLIVVDDTTAMAPYAERLAALPELIQTTLRPEYDLRVAVTTNGGALRGPYLSTRLGFDLTRTSSFDGSLADAIRPAMNVGATNSSTSQPLGAMRTALEGNPDFLRENAALGVVIISASDDASPDAVSEYATWLKTFETERTVVTTIEVAPSPRLDSFLSMLPTGHSASASLDDANVGAAFTAFESTIVSIIPGVCWTASDVDPSTPGAQYDCALTADVDGAELVLRQCHDADDDDPLCWRLVPSSQGECGDYPDEPLEPQIAAYHFFWFSPTMHAQCVVLDAP